MTWAEAAAQQLQAGMAWSTDAGMATLEEENCYTLSTQFAATEHGLEQAAGETLGEETVAVQFQWTGRIVRLTLHQKHLWTHWKE
jgi:hypothetical protein